MARFVLTTLGSLGDLYPIIGVARALAALNQQAVVAAAPEYREAVEDAGVGFAPVRPGFAELGDYRTIVEKAFDIWRGPAFLIRELVLPYLRQSFDDLWRATEGADFLVSHPLTFAMPMVAAGRRLPWAAAVLSPMNLISCRDFPAIAQFPLLDRLRFLGPSFHRVILAMAKLLLRRWEGPVRQLRRELSLPLQPGSALFDGQFSPLLNLALFDRQLTQPQSDWPGHVLVCGATFYDGLQPPAAVVDEIVAFLEAGDPPLVFALGSSVSWLAGEFWRQAVSAASALGCRALLVTGSCEPPPLPQGMLAVPSIPYSRVFPAAAAIVHQAGIGTLSQAMRAGRPQLIVPMAFDQPDNARRASDLGVARVLPFRKITQTALTGELGRVLGDPSIRDRSRQVAGNVQMTGAADAAAALVAALGRN
jgi:UDP:flavonoid glycosyltransferase YjiC (YdhE family)